MKFSIVIPTLNEENYLGRLLDSLADQTFKDFEVLIVDAHSEDGTVRVAEDYNGKLFIRILDYDRRSVGAQRNFGVQNAQAEGIVFMDADGMAVPDLFEKAAAYLSKRPVDMLTTWLYWDSNKFIDSVFAFVYNFIFLNISSILKPGCGAAFLYFKKAAFEDLGGFDSSIVVGEDFDLINRAAKRGYKFAILKNSKVITSARRLEKMGRFSYLKTILSGFWFQYFRGLEYERNVRSATYKMLGGAWYGLKNKAPSKTKVLAYATYLKKIVRPDQ